MSLAITYRRSGDPAEILEVTKIGEPRSPGLVSCRYRPAPSRSIPVT
jgi:hypothetical protein